MKLSPDIALLQEVSSIPNERFRDYAVVTRRATSKGAGRCRFHTAILVRGKLGPAIKLRSRWPWVDRELDHFSGNLVAHEVSVGNRTLKVLSVHIPAWEIPPSRLAGVDVEHVKLPQQPTGVWLTELLWASLLNCSSADPGPWVIAGDFNTSETFDYLWGAKPRGNREFLDRMSRLGFLECLRASHGELVPTFRNPRNKKIIHQMDHLFVSSGMASELADCWTGDRSRVFDANLSDHLPIVAEFS